MRLFSSAKDNLFLGLDIGDSSLKMVELKKKSRKIYLSNYAFSENIKGLNFTKIKDPNYLAQAILKVKSEAGIKAKRVSASLPTYSVFSSLINLPTVDKRNMDSLVMAEAKKLIPLPLEEMIIDWKLLGSQDSKEKAKESRVFLTASPKKLVRYYIEIFRLAKMELVSLETETFSLVRALMGNDPSVVMLVEIGANSTDLSIIQESVPIFNRSLELSGNMISSVLAESLGLDLSQAEQFKIDSSLFLEDEKPEILQILVKTLAPIVHEIEYMREFYQSNFSSQKIEKIILSGGGSLLPGFSEYLSHFLDLQVIVGSPFGRVVYPNELKDVITNIGPKLAVATGLALREIT